MRLSKINGYYTLDQVFLGHSVAYNIHNDETTMERVGSPFLPPVAIIAALALPTVRSFIRRATATARVRGTARRKTRFFVQINAICYVCQLRSMLLEETERERGRERERERERE